MTSYTPKHALPYADGTELAGNGDLAIKNLALAVDAKLTRDVASSGGVVRWRNVAGYEEGSPNLTGYLIIQTNLTYGNHMMKLHLQGYNYGPERALIDLHIGFYAYDVGGGSVINSEVKNNGTMRFNDVLILQRVSDGKVAIALNPNVDIWQYPKVFVDVIMGHIQPADAAMQGWTMFRVAALTGYTTKKSIPEQGGWQVPTWQNGWSSYSSWDVRYRRWNGEVIIRGMAIAPAGGGGGITMFTLPVGYRPSMNHMFPQSDASRVSTPTYLMTDGRVYPMGAVSTAWFCLDGIRFVHEI